MARAVELTRVAGRVRVSVILRDGRPPMVFSLPPPEAVSVGRRLELMGLEEQAEIEEREAEEHNP